MPRRLLLLQELVESEVQSPSAAGFIADLPASSLKPETGKLTRSFSLDAVSKIALLQHLNHESKRSRSVSLIPRNNNAIVDVTTQNRAVNAQDRGSLEIMKKPSVNNTPWDASAHLRLKQNLFQHIVAEKQ